MGPLTVAAYESGISLFQVDETGTPREFVSRAAYESMVAQFQALARVQFEFAKAHGLTDEMFAEWKNAG